MCDCNACTTAADDHKRQRLKFACWLIDHHFVCDCCQPLDHDQPCERAWDLTRYHLQQQPAAGDTNG